MSKTSKESYRGFQITYKSVGEHKHSFKITKDGYFDRPCGCYWCHGKWWKTLEKAQNAAKGFIDVHSASSVRPVATNL